MPHLGSRSESVVVRALLVLIGTVAVISALVWLANGLVASPAPEDVSRASGRSNEGAPELHLARPKTEGEGKARAANQGSQGSMGTPGKPHLQQRTARRSQDNRGSRAGTHAG